MNSILKVLKNEWPLLGVCIFAFTISFDPDWSSKALILVIIMFFFNLDIRKVHLNRKYLFILLLTGVYIVINKIILIKTISFSNFATTGLCILFFLLMFNTRKKIVDIKKVIIFFTAGVFTVGVINLFVFFFQTKNYYIINTWELYSVIDIHKIYFGAFLNLSLLMMLYLNTKKEISSNIIFSLTPVFVLLLFYTGSLSNGLIFILIWILFLSYKFVFSFYRNVYLLLLLGPVLIFLVLSTAYGKDLLYKIEGEGSRVRNFEVSKSIILKSPIYGYGIGNELYALQNERSKNSWEYINKYNAHNQYYEDLIGGGVLYLVLSIFPVIYINIKKCKLNDNLFANGFTLILSYIFLIESFLQRHHGQIFFAFFVSLIIYEMKIEKLE